MAASATVLQPEEEEHLLSADQTSSPSSSSSSSSSPNQEKTQSLRELLSIAIASLDPPRRSIELTWTIRHTVPRKTERRVLPLLVERGVFSSFGPHKWASVTRLIRRQEFQITFGQACSLYSQYLAEKTMHTHTSFKIAAPMLLDRYNQGVPVLTISREADVPPVTVMREILRRKWKCQNRDIKAALNKDSKLFNARDRRELLLAEKHDIVANIDKAEHQQKAAEFEERVHHYFSETLGVRCQSEGELQDMQLRLFNKQLATPDLLFLDQVTINNQPVHWIDAKNMYGASMGMSMKRLTSQAEKYLKEFGTGAFLFSHSFCTSLHTPPGVLLLEISSIPELAHYHQ